MTDLVFADELPDPASGDAADRAAEPWVVMIVDDDVAVHEVTQLVMAGFEFSGRRLQFLDAYSAGEARELLRTRSDIALILLDVVMESEHAGLDLARHIREDLGNRHVRIVLRTGQPGQAPEEEVIKAYDINDYKEKTELTRRKLITVFYAALRSYRDLMIIEQSRLALRRSIDAITRVYDSHNLSRFASAVLEQVAHLLGYDAQGLCASRMSAYAASHVDGRLKVLAATPGYSRLLAGTELDHLPAAVRQALDRALRDRQTHFDERHFVGYYRSSTGNESLLYMEFCEPLDAQARELLEIFCANVALTYESLLLREEIEQTQRATVEILGGAIESRSPGGSAHVRRVGELAALLAAAAGLPEAEVEFLRQAAPLHDVGKVGVPDAILNKPGPLEPAEWAQMQTHARLGFEMLGQSERRILRLGATIAHEHREHWDGSGYPRGLAGDGISIAARIVALADVLDALVCQRVYRPARPLDEALAHVAARAGTQFDPTLVQLLQSRLPAVRAIYARDPEPAAG